MRLGKLTCIHSCVMLCDTYIVVHLCTFTVRWVPTVTFINHICTHSRRVLCTDLSTRIHGALKSSPVCAQFIIRTHDGALENLAGLCIITL